MGDPSPSRSGGVLGKLFSSTTTNNDFALPSALNKEALRRPSPASLRPSLHATARSGSPNIGTPRSAGSGSASPSLSHSQYHAPSAYAGVNVAGRPANDRRGSEPLVTTSFGSTARSHASSASGPPARPPKPDGLRIKKSKAKALSISLLSGASPSAGTRCESMSTPSTPYDAPVPRASADLLGVPRPAVARHASNASVAAGPKTAGAHHGSSRSGQTDFPPRSQSALGHYDAQEKETLDPEALGGRKRKSSGRLLGMLAAPSPSSTPRASTYDEVQIIARAPIASDGVQPPARTSSSSIRDAYLASVQPPPLPVSKARPPTLPQRLPDAGESTFLASVDDGRGAPSTPQSASRAVPNDWGQVNQSQVNHGQQRSRSGEAPVSPPKRTQPVASTASAPQPRARRKFSMSTLLDAAPRSLGGERSGAEGSSAALPQSRSQAGAQDDPDGTGQLALPSVAHAPPALVEVRDMPSGAGSSFPTDPWQQPSIVSPRLAGSASQIPSSSWDQQLPSPLEMQRAPPPRAHASGHVGSTSTQANRKPSALAGLSSKFMRSTDRLADGGEDRSAVPSPTLIAPPPRHKLTKSYTRDGQLGAAQSNRRGDWDPSHGSQSGGVAHTIGQFGAAVGKKGLGMMRSWNASQQGAVAPPPEVPGQLDLPSSSQYGDNAATRRWISAMEGDTNVQQSKGGFARPAMATAGAVFGVPLRDAVLRARLLDAGASHASTLRPNPSTTPRPLTQLEDLDLGLDFSVPIPASSSDSIMDRRSSPFAGGADLSNLPPAPASQAEARKRYVPAVVVRCLESLERWGCEEEGIYRISGRSSHTIKLRSIFDRPGGDLELQDIGPADLDLNSVSSLLKHYLRELPEPLLTQKLAKSFDEAAVSAAGSCATSGTGAGGGGGLAMGMGMFGSSTSTDRSKGIVHPDQQSLALAQGIAPLMPSLPTCNWYLLREIAQHLSILCQPEVVARTKMPLNNLGLVLAPTLGLSVVMMRALIQHHTIVFSAGGPTEKDEQLGVPQAMEPASPGVASSYDPDEQAMRLNVARRLARPSTSPGIKPEVASGLLTVSRSSDAMDKRDSNSSVATLRAALDNMVPRMPYQEAAPEEAPDSAVAPIAARFARSRTASNASALTSLASGWSVADLPPSPMFSHQRLDSSGSSVRGDKVGSTSSQLAAQVSPSPSSSFSAGTGAHVPAAWESSSNSSSSRRTSEDGETGAQEGSRKASSTAHASHSSHSSSIDRPRPPTGGSSRFVSKKNGQKIAPIVTRFRSQTTTSHSSHSPRRLPPLQANGLSISHSSPDTTSSLPPDSRAGLGIGEGAGYDAAAAKRSQTTSPATPLAALP